ncbi:MAG TPA: OmpA family protein [Chitinophagaceae bacterium]|nr:OmpA family protein [Chitinophagaceae bacterium]
MKKDFAVILCIYLFLAACTGSDQRHTSTEKKSVAVASINEDVKAEPRYSSDLMMSDTANADKKKDNRITGDDGDWSAQNVVLANTQEAEWMIRAGDIDNLGFGWEEGFTPFSGKSTFPHGFPWDRNKEDIRGTDQIIVPSGYKPGTDKCGADGYTATTMRPDNNPRSIALNISPVKTTSIHSAYLQLFVDDFQSPVFCTKFQARLNDLRFIEMEKLLNVLQQTGPVGKLINVKLPDEFLPLLKGDSITLFIDDPVSGAGDGFSIDFIKLLINPKGLVYKGSVEGIVIDKSTRKPIANASAEIKDYSVTATDKGGKFSINNIPAGLNIITGSASGYASAQVQADIIANDTTKGIIIELFPSEKIVFDNKTMREGDELVLNNIQFEVGSAMLTDTAKQELDKLSAFMNQNGKVEILLSGHTSTDGTGAFNKALSLNRVKSCRLYLIAKGIDEGRIEVFGYGSEKPVVPNDTEKNRSKNRRVEMKITKL